MIRLQRAVLGISGLVVLTVGVAICVYAWIVEDYAVCLNLLIRRFCNVPAPPLAALITLVIGGALIVGALRVEDDEGLDVLDDLEDQGIRIRDRRPR